MNQLCKFLTITIFCLSVVACSKDTTPGNNPFNQSTTGEKLSKRDATKRIFSIYKDSSFTLRLIPTATCLNKDLLKPYQQDLPQFNLQVEESADDLESEEIYGDSSDDENAKEQLEEVRNNEINIDMNMHIFDGIQINLIQKTQDSDDNYADDDGKIWYRFSDLKTSGVEGVSLVDKIIDEANDGKIWLKFKLSNIPGLMNNNHPENGCEEIYAEISNF